VSVHLEHVIFLSFFVELFIYLNLIIKNIELPN
jgi:hypothetical protein